MRQHAFVLAAGALAIGTIGYAAQVGAPKARYQMDVSTVSGFMGGGGNAMKMMMGGGGSVVHQLRLRLGSSLTASGSPAADHFVPQGLGLGASVPLVTPGTGTSEESTPYKRPKGRLLLFWGCGPHAGPGQPVVIDFAKIAAGQFPPGLFSVSVPADTGPTVSNSRTYGEWPNPKSNKQLKGGSSLLGDHRVAGNYNPEIKFALDQDFMSPLQARMADRPGGSQILSWGQIGAATGYYAWAMGAKDMGRNGDGGDMVWWASSNGKEFGGGLADWIAPSVVSGLITRKVVMPPSQTSCEIPAEVKAAAGGFVMTMLYAYGPERSFAYPPRPANPQTPWTPEWTTRVRYRSMTSVIGGMEGMGDMGAMSGAQGDNAQGDDGEQAKPKKKCKPGFGLGGIKLC